MPTPKILAYQEQLKSTPDWDAFLRAESRLPGPRGNLELAHAAAQVGSPEQFARWAAVGADEAPTNDPGEFVAFCGVLGHGRLLAEGQPGALDVLRRAAADPRWRVREAAATALQTWGDADLPALQSEMERWARGSFFEQRAAVAGLCEPRLLARAEDARRVLEILDGITARLAESDKRSGAGFEALRKALGYGWSVAVAALPEEGWAFFNLWAASPDPDIRWIVRENLKKQRMKKAIRD